ncbi:MAG: hypothetical protein GXO19_01680 [Epsilonproteobacteria bacterium]|nr:hypothetical protein [Campylobacterota bacterium]NPA56426.1 hypothetical protein [Campylobacterota bacterium]
MRLIHLFIAGGIVLFSLGCAARVARSSSVMIVWKSPQIRYGDTAFMSRTERGVTLQLYQAGQGVMKLSVGKRICIDGKCMAASQFVKKFLSPHYPPTIVRNILLGRPIFGGQGLERTRKGFLQRIEGDHLDIIYRVSQGSIYFKDRKNGILITIKELHG